MHLIKGADKQPTEIVPTHPTEMLHNVTCNFESSDMPYFFLIFICTILSSLQAWRRTQQMMRFTTIKVTMSNW